MKNKYILLLIFLGINLFGQTKKIFNIETKIKSEIEINKIKEKIDLTNDENIKFFEDEKYFVNSICRGEWGGTIIFKNKQTNSEFICGSTCSIIISKFKGKYIITNTLNHLSGMTEILEIINPENLKKIDRNEKKSNIDETLGRKGAKILIKKYNNSTLFSFIYNEKLFHIVTDFKETFIAKIDNGEFIKIQTLSNKSFWTYQPRIMKNEDDSFVIYFNNYKNNGYIEIKENNFKVFTSN